MLVRRCARAPLRPVGAAVHKRTQSMERTKTATCNLSCSDAAAAAIAEWVKAGGTLFVTSGGGLLNEANMTNVAMETLLGIEAGPNAAYVTPFVAQRGGR